MSEVESIQSEPGFAAFIGIDWADQKHIWCLQTAGSKQRESGELEHTPEAVESWVANLYQRFAPCPIAVAVPGAGADGRQHAASSVSIRSQG